MSIVRRETREQLRMTPPARRRDDTIRRGLVVHWPGVNWPGADWSARDHSVCQQKWREWQAFHMSRGSNDIEYGSALCYHRVWMEGRIEFDRWDVRVGSNGTAEANYLYGSFSILIGPDDPLTQDLLRAAGEVVREHRDHGFGNVLKGHRDIVQTTCPGDAVFRAIPLIEKYAQEEPDMPLSDADIERIAAAVNRVGGDFNASGKERKHHNDGEDPSPPEMLDARLREVERIARRLEKKVDGLTLKVTPDA